MIENTYDFLYTLCSICTIKNKAFSPVLRPTGSVFRCKINRQVAARKWGREWIMRKCTRIYSPTRKSWRTRLPRCRNFIRPYVRRRRAAMWRACFGIWTRWKSRRICWPRRLRIWRTRLRVLTRRPISRAVISRSRCWQPVRRRAWMCAASFRFMRCSLTRWRWMRRIRISIWIVRRCSVWGRRVLSIR